MHRLSTETTIHRLACRQEILCHLDAGSELHCLSGQVLLRRAGWRVADIPGEIAPCPLSPAAAWHVPERQMVLISAPTGIATVAIARPASPLAEPRKSRQGLDGLWRRWRMATGW